MRNSDSSVQFDFKPPFSEAEVEAHMQFIAQFLVDLVREYRDKRLSIENTVMEAEYGAETHCANEMEHDVEIRCVNEAEPVVKTCCAKCTQSKCGMTC